jgi:hypothetical protein
VGESAVRARGRFLVVAAAILGAVPLMAQERPPAILEIYRDPVLPGKEAAFRAVEEDAARICAKHGFPNPHVAIESLTGPKEVWWLNAFESEAHKQKVTDEYASNTAVVAGLTEVGKRREGLVGPAVDTFVHYRADLSRGASWSIAGARFFVVTVTKGDPIAEGSVFEADDGTRFVFRSARERGEADLLAAKAGPGTTVFAVRPYWGMAAQEWIAADPDFWKANPAAARR